LYLIEDKIIVQKHPCPNNEYGENYFTQQSNPVSSDDNKRTY
jgi:hypothetical protein